MLARTREPVTATAKENRVPRIDWNETLELGVAKLDKQHQRIARLMNDLCEAYARGKSQDVVDEAVGEAHDYIDFHFNTEQRLMEEHEFPGIEAHVDEHDDYILQVSDHLLVPPLDGEGPSDEVLEYLVSWWTAHIAGPDRELAAHLKARGVR